MIKHDYRNLINLGWVVIIFGVGGVLLWSILAKLESASIAYGVVEPIDGEYPVQHLEGGIIKKVHVKNGAMVKKGDLLIDFDDTSSRAQSERIEKRIKALEFDIYRLTLEYDNQAWSVEKPFDNNDFSHLIASQKNLFNTRQKERSIQLDILDKQVSELNNEIKGLQEERTATKIRQEITEVRLSDMKDLISKKMISKTEILKLKAALAGLRGNNGKLGAEIAKIKQKIGEVELNKLKLKQQFLKNIISEIKETRDLVSDLSERLKVATSVFDRNTIHAEVDGKITGLEVKLSGEVIDPRQVLMKIVPINNAMIIRARITPDDIDVVRAGLLVDIRLTALSHRRTQPLKGSVKDVFPNLKESINGESYFEAILEIDPLSLLTLDKNLLYSGMTAELAIITGQRTAWRYFLAPILESVGRSLREQ